MVDKINSATPYGYLFELCLKNLIPSPPATLNSFPPFTFIKNILNDSKDLFSLLDVEPYSVWDTEFNEGISTIHMIGELNCLYSNFQFPQLAHTQINRIISGLFDWISNSTKHIKISNILEFTKLLTISCTTNGLSMITVDELKKRFTYGEELDHYLDIFSHKSCPNQDFNAPNEFEHVDSFFKPLIQYENELYLSSRSWIGIPIYEAIFQYYLNHIEEFSNKMGFAMENFVSKELQKLGIKFYSGKYKISKNVTEEVDFVLEFKDMIVFIELKKKTLTRKSRGGDTTTGLIDLHKSLLDSHIQTLKHETYLLNNNQIHFEDKTTLKYNGQQIERISLSLWELGFLQDKPVVKKFLKMYFKFGFTAPDPHEHNYDQSDLEKKFRTLNKKCDQFRELIQKRHNFSPIDLNQYFLGSWFLSIPQLLMLFDDCKSKDDFPKQLKIARNVTTKSLDFYFEYSNANRIINHGLNNSQMIMPQPKQK